MELTASELWSQILTAAKPGLPEQTFRTWLATTSATALADDELHVEASSEFHVQWLEDKYGTMLENEARKILGRPLRIVFVAGDPGSGPSIPSVEVTPPSSGASGGVLGSGASSRSGATSAAGSGGIGGRGEASSAGPSSRDKPKPGLNERYTFDRFVVGSNNQLAAAACHAVAEKPARMYNPLFLYGGVGLGKTHLMHAIGNHILEQSPEKYVAYVPSEHFMNELVTSIQEGTTPEFRRRYRQMDLLLVDDVHFLEGKERTQEEFFHTFNALYDAHRQIILASDRPPKEIPGLEERLISRFEWGLVADIKPPDYETRVAILRKKADDDRLTLDTEVMDFIARSCTSSVRELEGAVIKLLAYSSLRNQEINVSLARTALRGVLRDEDEGARRELSPEHIREVVAKAWDVKPEGLQSRRRTRDLTVPRQVAMYLIRDLLDLPLARIGDHFGGRDHSTVIHSINKVEEEMEENSQYRNRVEGLRARLTEPA
ncbi:MAG: chromosomal replication initiator protein DnaA [Longimicrobiales bacterium]